jgi:hypothetical protein
MAKFTYDQVQAVCHNLIKEGRINIDRIENLTHMQPVDYPVHHAQLKALSQWARNTMDEAQRAQIILAKMYQDIDKS